MFCPDGLGHALPSLVQRPVAPHGSTRPESVTGRPSSSETVPPPKRGVTTLSRRHVRTDGARPVV